MVIYRRCDQLPLKNFFKVIESNDYKYLFRYPVLRHIIRKNLGETWEKIVQEYAELDHNNEALNKFEAYKEAHQLAATYDIINSEIYYLHYKYKKEYVDDLAMLGYKIDVVDNRITLESLQRCKQMSRVLLNDIESLKKQLEIKEEPKKKKNVFESIIARFYEGFGPGEYKITVSQYIALKNTLNAKIKRENGQDRRK